MRAIILAGGQGTRLRPYTTLIPKPLVPIGDKYSIMEIVLKQLANSGFTHITIAVNHLAHLIMSYFGDGSRWNIKIDYSLEEEPLSTIGPLTLIDGLPENFLVMNGDILCNLDYGQFLKDHITNAMDVSVAAYKRVVDIDFGTLTYDESGNLLTFAEKPKYDFDVSMGVYAVNRRVIESLPRGKPYGFDQLMTDGIKENRKIRICPFSGYWLDIGRPEDYQTANQNIERLNDMLGLSI